MGMLSSFLCCGTADAKDDSDDKYHKQTTRRVASAPSKMGGSKPSSAAQDAKRDVKSEAQVSTNAATSKPALDDEPSVNEGDTITNNENNNINNNGEVSKPTASAGKEDASKDVVTEHVKVDHDKVVPAEEAEVSPPASDPGKTESVEEAAELGELGDLSKIQDGQSFNPETGFLLGRKDTQRFGTKKCLILDLDETLVHSSFKYLRTADFVIPVEIDDQIQHVYVIKRPGVDEFLRKVGQWYEVVVFTASVAKYGDPLLNRLDISKSIHYRLFRDSCYNYQGNFIKNLSQIGRPLSESIIIDNSPASYMFHPSHAVPISSWFSDTHDNELLDLLPILEDLSKQNVDDVSLVLDVAI